MDITPAYLSYMVNGKRPWREELFERYCQLVNTVNNEETVLRGEAPAVSCLNVVGRAGIEPATPGLKVREQGLCSRILSVKLEHPASLLFTHGACLI